MSRIVDGRPQIVADPPLIIPLVHLLASGDGRLARRACLAAVASATSGPCRPTAGTCSASTSSADIARKVVGVGSVGTRCWIVLMLGRDESDPLFLQVKEARQSVLSQFVGPSRYSNQGQRVVAGQRLMQAASDIFLGWQRPIPGWTGGPGTSTSASSGTGSSRWTSRACRPRGLSELRRGLRVDAGARPRPVGRPDRDCGVPRQLGRLRQGHRQVCRQLRRPEQAGLRRALLTRQRSQGGSWPSATCDIRLTGRERRRQRGA